MNELEELCKTLKKGLIKSKQQAFNLFKDDIAKAAGLYGWRNVATFINNETETQLKISTYKSMFKRAIKSKANDPKTIKHSEMPLTSPTKPTKAISKDKSHSPPSAEQDIKAYLRVCFNNKIIAQQAIENDISIETIKSWGCANFVQVSTAIGNHTRNKRK